MNKKENNYCNVFVLYSIIGFRNIICCMKKVVVLFIIAVASIFVFSCQKEQNAPGSKTNIVVLPSGGDAVVQANNTFAFSFLRAMLQQDAENNNKLISPLSIYLALSMVYNGADNATKDSIAHALQLSGLNINTLNEVCQSLITQLPGEDSRVDFFIANSIWYNKNSYQPLPSFLTTVQNYYEASMQPTDFDDPFTVNTINSWGADQTHNKIKKIIDAVSPGDLMYLINAIYFKGAWQTKFPSSNTHDDVFYAAGGAVTVPFMTNEMVAHLYADSLFRLVELPYGGGNSYSMYIALPVSEQMSANSLAAVITETMLTNAIHNMGSNEVKLTIPKWEYSYSIDNMQPALSLLGMDNAFTDSADFSKAYNSSQVKPQITKAVHKTYIKVDEEGTEAVAVTEIGFGVTDISIPYPFVIDHPFLYAIIEKQTGAILFTGILNTPKTE